MPNDTKLAYLYVVECADGTLYTGYTTDVDRRIQTHNKGKGAKYTRARLPVKLIYQESFESKQAAMSAENHFKRKTRQAKLDYIKQHKKKSNLIFDFFGSIISVVGNTQSEVMEPFRA